MNVTELPRAERFEPPAELAAAVRSRRRSARSVLADHLARVDARNHALNAVVTRSPVARQDADRVDDVTGHGEDPGLLAGVPFTVKDSIATSGLRTTAGSVLFAEFVPSASATAVRRLQDAGAVLVGKTNTPELALDLHTDNAIFGATRNPCDSALTPGGSSGGEAAAVRAGMSAIGLGTDFGASGRWPAQCTGLVGLRPTVGRVPTTGTLPYFGADGYPAPDPDTFLAQTQVVAPIARRVADLELVLRVLSGPDDRDPLARDEPLEVAAEVDVTGLRVAWFESDGSYPVSAEVMRAVALAASVLTRCGLTTTRHRPAPIVEAEAVYDLLRTADNASWMSVLPDGGGDAEVVRRAIAASRAISRDLYARALRRRADLRHALAAHMRETPILITAVSGIPAFPAGETVHRVGGVVVPRRGLVAPCRAIGLFGLPAVSVPVLRTAAGAYVSVQVVGRPWAESEVFAVAALLEQECPLP
jgi:Asp-tRNA(Asn)/Glu-tRNA(Gln) amidotransferase A subunit family amidase